MVELIAAYSPPMPAPVIARKMAKLAKSHDSAVKAVQAGVDKVSFVDGRVPHSILLEIFTTEGIGTELLP